MTQLQQPLQGNEYTLVESSKPGRLALGSPDGQDITSGMRLSICIDDKWIAGRAEGDGEHYHFIGVFFKCKLQAGMKVRV